jgi:hypothetical protein
MRFRVETKSQEESTWHHLVSHVSGNPRDTIDIAATADRMANQE